MNQSGFQWFMSAKGSTVACCGFQLTGPDLELDKAPENHGGFAGETW